MITIPAPCSGAYSGAYLVALRRYLNQSPATLPLVAGQLGRRALKCGMKTLDLVHLHSETLTQLLACPAPLRQVEETIRRAGLFFAGVLTPLEEIHRNAEEANVDLKIMIAALHQRTGELAGVTQQLIGEIFHRETVEDALRTSEVTSRQMLVKSHQMQEDLRDLSRRLLMVQEAERKKISRQLHDVIGQSLTGINLRLAVLKAETAPHGKELNQKISHTQDLVEKSVSLVHRVATDLRPTVLDDLGLIPALHAYILAYRERTGIRVNLTACAEVEQVEIGVRTMFYRIVQEALTNVAQHAKASRASVRIAQPRGGLLMEITDHGTGFRVDETMAAPSRQRLGLLGMRERVEMVGGTFSVESAPGKETVVRVEMRPGRLRGPKGIARSPGHGR